MKLWPFFPARITMCSSIFLVMGTAVERYLAVCRPHHYRNVKIIFIYNIYMPWRLLQQQNYFSRFKTNHSALLPTLYPAWWRQHWWTFQGYKLSSVKLFLGQNLIKMMEILVNDWKLKYTLQFARWRNLWVFLQLFHIGWCSLVQSPLHHFIIIQSGKCTSSKLLHFLLS